ncbi:hypothetical protein ABKV19_001443 [Rosa sericea]
MESVNWTDLPKELWPIITESFHSRIDILRFRSICSLWHSTLPPSERFSPPPFPLKFSSPSEDSPGNHASLFQSTIYRMESCIDEDNCGSSASNLCSKPWLVKFEEDPSSGIMRLLDPVTSSPLRYSPNTSLKELNLLEYRIVELHKSYGLKFGENNVTINSVHNLVVLPRNNLDFGDVYVCAVFMIYNEGKLGFMRFGDEKLTHVDEENSYYDDIIVYKGQCYVVDKWGTISSINSALEVIQFSPPLSCGFGGQKHLVESCGDLYVVDQYYERVSVRHGREDEYIFGKYHNSRYDSDAIDFKVYKLDQEWSKWDNVKNLGDHVFLLSKDGSFSVSTREFDGVKGNCIFFIERVSPTVRARYHSRVFDLEDGSMRDLASLPISRMVEPPSTWLSPDLSSSASECECEILMPIQ